MKFKDLEIGDDFCLETPEVKSVRYMRIEDCLDYNWNDFSNCVILNSSNGGKLRNIADNIAVYKIPKNIGGYNII